MQLGAGQFITRHQENPSLAWPFILRFHITNSTEDWMSITKPSAILLIAQWHTKVAFGILISSPWLRCIR